MIIKGILLLILFICCINLIQVTKNANKDFFSKILKVALLFIFVHALHVLLSECFFPHLRYVDSAAPYGLVYGPLFYFLILGLKNNKLKSSVWILHLIPFVIFYLFYLVFLFNDGLRLVYIRPFIRTLYTAIPMSFLIYIVASIFQKQKFIHQPSFAEIKDFVTTMGMFLVFMSIFFYVVRYTGGNETHVARLVVYGTMLSLVLYIFVHLLRKKTKNGMVLLAENSSDSQQSKNETKYTKVKITEAKLDEYEVKLYRSMEESKIFLDAELTLDKLAKELKIPNYHLSQLFSLRVGKNFNQFVNTSRINFACSILNQRKDIKMEEVIYQCGFNSKTSFNRHFKTIIGVTPSEYYSQEKE